MIVVDVVVGSVMIMRVMMLVLVMDDDHDNHGGAFDCASTCWLLRMAVSYHRDDVDYNL